MQEHREEPWFDLAYAVYALSHGSPDCAEWRARLYTSSPCSRQQVGKRGVPVLADIATVEEAVAASRAGALSFDLGLSASSRQRQHCRHPQRCLAELLE